MLEKGLTLLDRGDVESICTGARILAESGSQEAIEPLFPYLLVRHEIVRDCVRDALNRLDVAPVLIRRWRSQDEPTRDGALDLAVPLSHPGLMEIYREAAADPDARRRRRVATGLRHQAPEGEILPLLEALSADPDHDVRWWAIDTLRLIPSDDAQQILKACLASETDPGLRPFILRALGITPPGDPDNT